MILHFSYKIHKDTARIPQYSGRQQAYSTSCAYIIATATEDAEFCGRSCRMFWLLVLRRSSICRFVFCIYRKSRVHLAIRVIILGCARWHITTTPPEHKKTPGERAKEHDNAKQPLIFASRISHLHRNAAITRVVCGSFWRIPHEPHLSGNFIIVVLAGVLGFNRFEVYDADSARK